MSYVPDDSTDSSESENISTRNLIIPMIIIPLVIIFLLAILGPAVGNIFSNIDLVIGP